MTKYKPKVFVSQITRLEEKHIEDQRNIKRMVEEQMRTQKEQAEAAISEARERSTAEKERYLRQQRDLQAQIDAAKRKQQQDEQTIKNLRDKLRRMWLRQRMKQEKIEDVIKFTIEKIITLRKGPFKLMWWTKKKIIIRIGIDRY